MLLKSLKSKRSHSNVFNFVFSNEAFEDFPQLKTKIQVICRDYLHFSVNERHVIEIWG